MSGVKAFMRLLAAFAVVAGLGVSAAAGQAAAEDTVWACLPGQTDDLCAGTITGNVLPPPGQPATQLGYTRPADAPVDCFYLYPTQSPQDTPNSNLDKDPPIKRVVVQQARQFSRVCDVYAPMYRQSTSPSANLDEYADIAYQSALSAWKDYLANYNQGRGIILLGHSQGSSHLGRLIAEEIDPDPELRSQLVGAHLPGANIHVPIGELVGGMYSNVPACSQPGEIGCLVAYSMYRSYPGPVSGFGQLNAGYWSFPGTRPDPAEFEVVCTDPTKLDGTNGRLRPLANTDYISDAPETESEGPWLSVPDYYDAQCTRQAGAHWLNVTKVDTPGDGRPDLASLVSPGNDLHTVDVNLAEDNLVGIAQLQTDTYLEIEDARVSRPGVVAKLNKARKNLKASQKKTRTLGKKLRKAKKQCRAAKRSKVGVKARCGQQKKTARKQAKAKRQVKISSRQVRVLTGQLKGIDRIIG